MLLFIYSFITIVAILSFILSGYMFGSANKKEVTEELNICSSNLDFEIQKDLLGSMLRNNCEKPEGKTVAEMLATARKQDIAEAEIKAMGDMNQECDRLEESIIRKLEAAIIES